jgi:hypothetical protein
VVDVPGDHFSLLRQEPTDMALLVTSLKAKLGAFGWAESVRRDRRQEYNMGPQVGAAGWLAGGCAAAAGRGALWRAGGLVPKAWRLPCLNVPLAQGASRLRQRLGRRPRRPLPAPQMPKPALLVSFH